MHPRLVKMHIAKRLAAIKEGKNIDFATAEALAFGSLVLEGFHVRLCGQDSGRVRPPFPSTRVRVVLTNRGSQGTFSQRHAVMSDQESVATTVPLEALTKNEGAGTIEVVNSPLSEYAVIGFEQGLAWVSPKMLPIWEAQVSPYTSRSKPTLTREGSLETLSTRLKLRSTLCWDLPRASGDFLPLSHSSYLMDTVSPISPSFHPH